MNKTEIFNTLDKLLTQQEGVDYDSDAERGLFHFRLKGAGKIKHLMYTIIVSDCSYSVIVLGECLSADAKDGKAMNNVAEFICRANYGIKNGNFNLDFSDGEIHFKTFVDCEDIPSITYEVFRDSISAPQRMFNRYGDGILEMIYGLATPEDAKRRAES